MTEYQLEVCKELHLAETDKRTFKSTLDSIREKAKIQNDLPRVTQQIEQLSQKRRELFQQSNNLSYRKLRIKEALQKTAQDIARLVSYFFIFAGNTYTL